MSVRTANAEWKGDLPSGSGTIRTESGALSGSYSFASRFEEGSGTNPEELVGAALAGCFSMALSDQLAQAGFTPESVQTVARVHLDKTDDGPTLTRIDLECDARVPGIGEDAFQEQARGAKAGCPVSRALAVPEITLEARLSA